MVYVPAVGNVIGPTKLLLQRFDPAKLAPSGPFRDNEDHRHAGKLELVVSKLTRWPAVPLKVRLIFWPGTVVPSATGEPPGVIVAVGSDGTSYNWNVALPVDPALGYAAMVYVPVVGSVIGPTKLLLQRFVPAKCDPSGPFIETEVHRHPEKFELVVSKLTRWPAVPLKVRLIF